MLLIGDIFSILKNASYWLLCMTDLYLFMYTYLYMHISIHRK